MTVMRELMDVSRFVWTLSVAITAHVTLGMTFQVTSTTAQVRWLFTLRILGHNSSKHVPYLLIIYYSFSLFHSEDDATVLFQPTAKLRQTHFELSYPRRDKYYIFQVRNSIPAAGGNGGTLTFPYSDNNNGGCDRGCTNTMGDFFCYCFAGYFLNNDNTTCSGD